MSRTNTPRMYHVWVDFPRLCVAKADSWADAVHYAHQYVEEGKVTVRHYNAILLTLVKSPTMVVAAPVPDAIHVPPRDLDLMPTKESAND